MTYRRGFVHAVTCTAADWLAHCDKLVWTPAVECPKCGGGRWKFEECRSCGSVYQYTNKYSDCGNPACEGADSGRTDCPRCHGTGRVPNPDPPAATCQPVREVTLTPWPDIEVSQDGANWLASVRHPGGTLHYVLPLGMSAGTAVRRACEMFTNFRWPGITFHLPLPAAQPAPH